MQIKVSPDQLDQVGSRFDEASQESQQMVERLRGSIDGLTEVWEGVAHQRFYQEFQEWQRTMVGFVELLNGIGQQLHRISEGYREREQEIMRMLGG